MVNQAHITCAIPIDNNSILWCVTGKQLFSASNQFDIMLWKDLPLKDIYDDHVYDSPFEKINLKLEVSIKNLTNLFDIYCSIISRWYFYK